MVLIRKLRLDITPILKASVCGNDEQRTTGIFEESNVPPRTISDAVQSVAYQPHHGKWEYERLAVASGSTVYIFALNSVSPKDYHDDTKEQVTKYFKRSAELIEEYRNGNSGQDTGVTDAKLAYKSLIQRIPLGHHNSPGFVYNDPEAPSSILLATITNHGRSTVNRVQWSPNGCWGGSMDSSVIYLWWYEGIMIRSFSDDPSEVQDISHVQVDLFKTFPIGNPVTQESWPCLTFIRAPSHEEWKDFTILSETKLAACCMKHLYIYNLIVENQGEKGNAVKAILEQVIHHTSAEQFVMLSSSPDGNRISALLNDETLKVWEKKGNNWVLMTDYLELCGNQTSETVSTPRSSFDCTSSMLSVPLGCLNGEHVGLISLIKNMSKTNENNNNGPSAPPNNLFTRLRGHNCKITGIHFSPVMYSVSVPGILKSNNSITIEICNRARMSRKWPTCTLAVITSVDGSLSVWKIFYSSENERIENEKKTSNKPDNSHHIKAISAICLLVFVPRFLDEQGLPTDVSWEPDGSGFVLSSDDGSLTTIKFSEEEINGDIIRNYITERSLVHLEENIELEPNSDLIKMLLKGRSIALEQKQTTNNNNVQTQSAILLSQSSTISPMKS